MKKQIFLFQLLLMLTGAFSPCYAEEYVSKEKKIKSAIILNFIRYTEWPESSFQSESDEINVCIYTDAEMEEVLLKSNGKKINDRKINIRVLYRLNNLSECHVLYANSLDRSQASRTYSSIVNKPVLTVTDHVENETNAGIINLIRDKGKLRFQISRDKCESAKLKLSSRLVKLSVNNKTK